jgi:ferredoxin-NADP reductase/predicted pyridoxine 5'-phosphate oxidase superfamily flavin-nucleotide-binding protein
MSEQPLVSPFHEGEREIQTRLGVRDKIEDIGQRFIRGYMPHQHRQFYGSLNYLVIGSVDASGRPWASMLSGQSGFVSTPDEFTLAIDTSRTHDDPLNANLAPGARLGVLGIQYEARRRNRLTGKVLRSSEESILLQIDQAFGNCPQYIQTRESAVQVDNLAAARPAVALQNLSERARAIIHGADHFFIATSYSEDADDVTHGTDVSHRGGRPGFVRIEGDRVLTFPDFAGNSHFNTLGNIVRNPHAGLLFIDFDSGDQLYLTCSAEIIWDSEEKRAFNGAERLLRMTIEEGLLIESAMPVTWKFLEYSPSLDQTGSWTEVAHAIAASKAENEYRNYRVTRVERESNAITSFYLQPDDADCINCHTAGQFLPIEINTHDQSVKRTYSISNAPNGVYYRLSVKREPSAAPDLPPGIASTFLHEQIKTGSMLKALPARGCFVLEESSARAVVLLSAGVGITPMISMLEQLAVSSSGCGIDRRVWFVHGARNGSEHAFRRHVQDIAAQWPGLTTHYAYSAPQPGDVPDEHYNSSGRVSVELLKKLLPFDDYDFYFCGPAPFMESIYEGLKDLNVSDERIHYEFFGPGATLLKEEPGHSRGLVGDLENSAPVTVRFARSGTEAVWDPAKGTLLDLAESVGLQPAYSCRSGICATCETKVESGGVAYTSPPAAVPQPGSTLLCCSYPSQPDDELVLDL